jgi:hypothetical protein
MKKSEGISTEKLTDAGSFKNISHEIKAYNDV